MIEAGDSKRRTARIVPGRPVFVAMEGARGPVARGLVSNISEGGACLSLAGPFDVGDDVILRLSFAQQPQPVPATGRVVWSGAAARGGARFGITWTHDGPQRQRLQTLIRANHAG
jgi:Tfp pilus assembly protein PilZ